MPDNDALVSPRPGPAERRGLAALFFAAGGLALTLQVTLLRELIVALQGDETAVGLGLAAWLAGIAAGAGAARALVRERPGWWAALGFGLLALAGPAEVIAGRLGRLALAPPPGELLPLGPAVLLAAAVLAPAGGLVGLAFTALAATAARAGWRPGQGIARLYVLESLGSLAGGLLVTFLVVPLLPPLKGTLVAAGAWTLLGVPAARARLVAGRRALPALAAALIVLALLPACGRIEGMTVKARFRGLARGIPLLAWTDTPYQHLAIGGGAMRHLYAGGQYAGSFPDPSEHESLAHILSSLSPRPGAVLLVGSGVHGTLRFLLAHPIERLDLVEIDRRALRLVRDFLPAADDRALGDPRVRIVHDDPRRFLARGAAGGAGRGAAGDPGRYDLIVILEPQPVTLLLARLSTVEFYRLCAAHLAPGGVLVVRLETAPNVLTGESAALGGSIWGALRQVFPVVRAGPGPESLLLAGTDPRAVTLDPGVLARRFEERQVTSEVFVPRIFPLLFPPERVAGQEAALDEAAAAFPASRDERPVSFLHALALRQRIAGGRVAPLFGRVARVPPPWLAALALLPSVLAAGWIGLARGSRDPGRSLPLAAMHAVVVTGGCGMAWSLLILFSYQTRAGALYGRIGLLAALFMLGLAAGGAALARGADRPAGSARRRLPLAGAAALLFALLMPAALRALDHPALGRAALPEILHGALLLLAGVITGSLFPVAAGVLLAGRRGVRETASGLEAADHVGAAVAALLGGVVFIPALGLLGTARLLAALQAVALAGVLAAATTRSRE
jgi:predicted membrane-bound spermidine synthase